MTADTAPPRPGREHPQRDGWIRYMVLGTIDEDGCTRTSPVYFVPPCSQTPTSRRGLRSRGTAREVQPAALTKHLVTALRPERGARAFTAEELSGEADLRLWVLRVDRWEVHISGAHPTLGSGTDRRTPVDPTE